MTDPRATMRKEYDFSSARRAKDVPHLAKLRRAQTDGSDHGLIQLPSLGLEGDEDLESQVAGLPPEPA